MNEQKRRAKQRLMNIKTLDEYIAIRDKYKLTKEQKEIMDMVFVDGYDYRLIADKTGYSERTIKQKVSQILNKLS